MAFDYTNIYPDTSGNGGFTKSWNYTSVVDNVATCAASGYFNKVASRLGIGDNIVVAQVDAFDKSRTALLDFGTLFVNSISGGVVTTLNITSINANNITSGTLAAARLPALTGDITTTVGTAATSLTANAVTNAKLATMAAWTFKVNNTSGLAVPTDIAIDSLTLKGTPAAADEIIIWDVAGTALKKVTVSSIPSGSVLTPTFQKLTSGTAATYTTPVGCTWIEVLMCGGGGGGAGAPLNAGLTIAGSDGTASTFNSVNANPGKGAAATTGNSGSAAGGAGGTAGTGTATRRMPGMPGASAGSQGLAFVPPTSVGGSSVLFGGGAPAFNAAGATSGAGIAGLANTGGGGSGAFNAVGSANNAASAGGGAECVYLLIPSPAATYTYTVGPGGLGGVSTNNGGPGGTGFIFVTEHYGS